MAIVSNPITVFVLVLMVVAWQAFLTFLVWKNLTLFQRLTTHTKGEKLDDILADLIENIEKTSQKTDRFLKRVEITEEKIPTVFQKMGFVRFNPYNEVGSDQSFSLALLDSHGRGFVLTSLHSRSMTRIYAKPVDGSKKSPYPLSQEEEEAVKLALKK